MVLGLFLKTIIFIIAHASNSDPNLHRHTFSAMIIVGIAISTASRSLALSITGFQQHSCVWYWRPWKWCKSALQLDGVACCLNNLNRPLSKYCAILDYLFLLRSSSQCSTRTWQLSRALSRHDWFVCRDTKHAQKPDRRTREVWSVRWAWEPGMKW